MPFEQVLHTLTEFRRLGAKSLQLTGGGNPVLYRDGVKNINTIIRAAAELGYKIGLITNSLSLTRLTQDSAECLSWVRISLSNVVPGETARAIDLASVVESKVGFSHIYAVSPEHGYLRRGLFQATTPEVVGELRSVLLRFPDTRFMRVAGDGFRPEADRQIEHDSELHRLRQDFPGRVFVAVRGRDGRTAVFADGCYVGGLRPFVACDPDGGDVGRVFICSCHSFFRGHRLDNAYSLGTVYEIAEVWRRMGDELARTGRPYNLAGSPSPTNWTQACESCYYASGNRLLHATVESMNDEDFA